MANRNNRRNRKRSSANDDEEWDEEALVPYVAGTQVGLPLLQVPRRLLTVPEQYARYQPRFQAFMVLRQVVASERERLQAEMDEIDTKRDVWHSDLMHMEDWRAEITLVEGEPFVGSAFTHGYYQRIKVALLRPMVWAVIVPATEEHHKRNLLFRLLRKTEQAEAGAHIVRLLRGFLGRVHARQRRHYLWIVSQATVIQRVWRGHFYGKLPAAQRRYWIQVVAAIHIQRIYRALLGRRRAQARREYLHHLLEIRSAIIMQSVVRMFLGRCYYLRIKAELEALRARRKYRAIRGKIIDENVAATHIQRVWRGLLGRRIAYAKRQESLVSHPRVRALADLYLSRGDLWGLLAAINDDYEAADRDRRAEALEARTFMTEILRVREQQELNDWSKWQALGLSSTKGSKPGRAASRRSGDAPSFDSDVYEVALPDRIPPEMTVRQRTNDRGKSPSRNVMPRPLRKPAGASLVLGPSPSREASLLPLPASQSRQALTAPATMTASSTDLAGPGVVRPTPLHPTTAPARSLFATTPLGANHNRPMTTDAGSGVGRPLAPSMKGDSLISFGVSTVSSPSSSVFDPLASESMHELLPGVNASVAAESSLASASPSASPAPVGASPSSPVASPSRGSPRAPAPAAPTAIISAVSDGLQLQVSMGAPLSRNSRRLPVTLEHMPHQTRLTRSYSQPEALRAVMEIENDGILRGDPIAILEDHARPTAAVPVRDWNQHVQAMSVESSLGETKLGAASARSLLRDLRGMDGPLDLLCLHAALRVVLPPPALLLSVGEVPIGEEAAQMFADTPPCLAKVQWENDARRCAAPAFETLKKLGCRCVADVAGVNLLKAGINSDLAGAIERIIRVIDAAGRHLRARDLQATWLSKSLDALQRPGMPIEPSDSSLLGTTAFGTASMSKSTSASPRNMKRTLNRSGSHRSQLAQTGAASPKHNSPRRTARSPRRLPSPRRSPSPRRTEDGSSVASPRRAGSPAQRSPRRANQDASPGRRGSTASNASRSSPRHLTSRLTSRRTPRASTKVVLAVADPHSEFSWWDEPSRLAIVKIQNAVEGLRQQLRLKMAIKELDEDFLPLFIQVAMEFPLPTPLLTGMKRARANGALRTRLWHRNRVCGAEELDPDPLPEDDPNVVLVVEYDTFLREVVLAEERSATAGDKQKLIINERVKVATTIAQVWSDAVHKAGFQAVSDLLGIRVDILTDILRDVQYGKWVFDMNQVVPPKSVASCAISLLELWLIEAPAMAHSLQQKLTGYDRRFQRSALDPIAPTGVTEMRQKVRLTLPHSEHSKPWREAHLDMESIRTPGTSLPSSPVRSRPGTGVKFAASKPSTAVTTVDPAADPDPLTAAVRGEKPWACDHPGCNLRFAQRYTLGLHKRSHLLNA